MSRNTRILLGVMAAVTVAAVVGVTLSGGEIAGMATGKRGPKVATKTNWLVIVGDDIGVDKISAYAADFPETDPGPHLPATPAIDSLGTSGLRFRAAWAQPLCSPSRVSLHTGVHPFRHGFGDAIPDEGEGVDPAAFEMVAEVFDAQGYATGFFGKWHLGTQNAKGMTADVAADPPQPWILPHPALAGFHDFFGTLDGTVGDYDLWDAFVYSEVPVAGSPPSWHDIYETEVAAHATQVVADETLDWIEAQTGPWIAFASFHAPHAADHSCWTYEDADPSCYRSPSLACLETRDCADRDRAVYQALVECMDLTIEGMLEAIPPTVLDTTMIVFVGDNGTPAEVEDGGFVTGHGKGTVQESGVHVPLFVAHGASWRTPGVAGRVANPGRVVDAPVEALDLYATMLVDTLAVTSTSPDSRSLADCFDNTTATCGRMLRYDYAETFNEMPDGTLSSGSAAVRYGTDKMIATYDPDGACVSAEFYDLAVDPLEATPVVWAGSRSNRLRSWLTAQHAGSGSWLDGVPFCG